MSQNPAQIVTFPFQRMPAHECETFRDGVYQLKLKAAAMLNDVAAGTYIMSPENVEAIQWVNSKCLEVGLTPLDFKTEQ